jgi:endoglucanase
MEAHLFRLTFAALAAASLTASGCGVFFPEGGGGAGDMAVDTSKPPTPTGCPATPNHPVAPGGYYVNGNSVCTEDGKTHLFHGVDRPSLEWVSSGEYLSAADFQLMASWKANVVRIALNQDFWLPGSRFNDPGYPALVDDAIMWAKQAGMDVILDLHWSDGGEIGSCDPRNGCQHVMADLNSLTFWTEVATRYKDDGRVMFELYNEPHDVDWKIWKSGGPTSEGWTAAGMQQMYDAVRATGANNLVVIGGLDWAFDLSVVKANRIKGYNIAYATHPYGGNASRAPSTWDGVFGYLTYTDPVIATEFGDLGGTCATDYVAQLIAYMDSHHASWTAWAWFRNGCEFPSLIDDWEGTPSPSGTVVRNALYRYAGMTPPPATTDGGASPEAGASSDAGGDGSAGN